MARGYTKEFLVEAFLYRYMGLEDIDVLCRLENMANAFYDRVGKDEFRVWCSLDAQAIKDFNSSVAQR